MRIKRVIIACAIVAVAGVAGVSFWKIKFKKTSDQVIVEIRPVRGSIKTVISSTGTVLPKNRLEVKPPVNGRIESILVQEGQSVAAGQVLAWMSSTERAALLDAARGKGEESLKYWEDAYKPIPLPAPIEGDVIVATTQPGQTVTTSEAIIVLSDRLIVRAQVDETDIGKITPAMKAVLSLDAYPETKIKATVDHIYYESKTVNNVTIYEVDMTPAEVPSFFRSGMNASIDFIQQNKDNVLLLPVEAVHKEKDEAYVWEKNSTPQPVKVRVTTGISNDKSVEILSGIGENDAVIIQSKKYSLPKNDAGTNPFMPARRR